ncbi:MAG TPA: hypothetical protein PK324_16765 [Nocardioides sp.]|uniref:hypothetical protein n=1 Tax=uncultured Nocardioides sp. TaxID=198441 RepID=UPI0026064648|nr:hypothetical protein [uncultured Nocardioides sp.]HRD63524.1 hypothetical protein [Nocardioides sp.]HRK47287.1 hypothetical protein [Nocardioides sp.]
MTIRPHDLSDLYLAPVVLAIDSTLERWGATTLDQVRREVVLHTNGDPATPEKRRAALLATLARPKMHGWTMSIGPRGVVLTHDDHVITLGVPDSVRSYLSL